MTPHLYDSYALSGDDHMPLDVHRGTSTEVASCHMVEADARSTVRNGMKSHRKLLLDKYCKRLYGRAQGTCVVRISASDHTPECKYAQLQYPHQQDEDVA